MENRKYSNEVQLEIDDVYGCPGHCPGCVLSSLERKNLQPDMAGATLVNSINQLKSYVKTLENVEKINLTYGIADHFLMSNEYLAHTYDLGAGLIEHANFSNPYNGVFYTSSMIGKHQHIMEKVEFMHNLSVQRKIPFYIIAVLDPKNLFHKKFADIYKQNIIQANELIGRVDLSINLSEEAIDMITPQELFEFALLNKFDEVTINWTPTFDNLAYVYMDQNKLSAWLIEFDRLIARDGKMGTSYRPVMMRTINNLRCKEPQQQYSFQENLLYNLPELAFKSLQIDDKGNVFPKYEAIGDIAHAPRLGFEPIGNVNSMQSIQQMFQASLNKTRKYITKQFVSEPCSSCEYSLYCANSGFHIYNHVLAQEARKNPAVMHLVNDNIKKNGCAHLARMMFAHYEAIAQDLDRANTPA